MSEHLRDLASLQAHYEDVIQTHKDLAAAFSSLVGTVVNGRLPGHDLAAMLKDLAEREELMAENWGFVRDGLVDKLRSDVHEWTIEVTTDVDSDEEVAEEHDADATEELDLRVVEEPYRSNKETSIASHLTTALANAVKPRANEDPLHQPVGNPEVEGRQAQTTRKEIEREAQWQRTRAKRIKKRDKFARKQARKDKLATQSADAQGTAPSQALQESAHARTHTNQADPQNLEIARPVSIPKAPRSMILQGRTLAKQKKKAAKIEAMELARKSTGQPQHHSRLPALVRAHDGRIIKQEAED